MAKQFKIKRRKRNKHGVYKAPPHPITIILTIAVIAGLVYLGIVIYPPVYDFVMNLSSEAEYRRTEESLPEEDSSAVEESSLPEPEPEPEPPKAVTGLNAVWMPVGSAASTASTELFLENIPAGTNAVVLDVKDTQGKLLYRSKLPKAQEWEAVTENAIDLEALAQNLSGKGISVVVRMQTFIDPVCARGDRENHPIKYQNSEMLWLDNYADAGGKPWSNPYAEGVREYQTAIARELAEMGAVMVILDGVRFPDDMTGSATYGPAAAGISRGEILKSFVVQVEEELAPLGVRTGVYVSATAVGHVNRDKRYGGDPLAVAGETAVIGILSEELSSGYLAEGVFVTPPARDAAATVTEVLAYVQTHTPVKHVIPVLQGGSTVFTAEQMQGQISAAQAAGCKESFLFSSTGAYVQ